MDQDHNGVINENEFRQLIINMNVVVQNSNDADNDIDTLLKIIDPFNNN